MNEQGIQYLLVSMTSYKLCGFIDVFVLHIAAGVKLAMAMILECLVIS